MTLTNRIKLSVMMFLEFFIWGAWFVTLGTFLGKNLAASGTQIGLAYLSQSIGAIIAPFIIGLIADRFFSAQKILGVLHLAGALLLWLASTAVNFNVFFSAILVYMILFMPTLALINSISFKQMKDPGKEFPSIRVLGTIGWILAGLTIGWLNWEQNSLLVFTFKTAAGASALLGIFSFTLPATPPMRKAEKTSISDVLGLDALRLLKNRSYLLFFISSVAICIPLAFYYNFTNLFLNETGMKSAAGIQSLGQVSETLFMLLIPIFFIRLGVKKMLAIGMLAWALRYLFFAYGNADANYWMLITGIVLHGICYDFFFVTGQIYTDNLAGEKSKSAAQGLITLATYGVGMLIGSLVSGPIVDAFKMADGHNWQIIWIIPAAISGVIFVLFVLLFRDKHIEKVSSELTIETSGH
ncbi:MFS transporter [Solitalea longa]|uniref:MFS transporter n=1 Tax=Solitalea longa TaxID=2079460 RepID=A0A2S4ZX04_9SPHI|nr:nucleoside permease [Solitalea longa]POY34888.1 MFS transporter [Solitalea longa]